MLYSTVKIWQSDIHIESKHCFSKDKTTESSNIKLKACMLSIFLFKIDSIVGTNHWSVWNNNLPSSIIPSYLLFLISWTQQSGSDFQYCVNLLFRSKSFSGELQACAKKTTSNKKTTVQELFFIRKNCWCFNLSYWTFGVIFSVIWRYSFSIIQ